MFKASAWGQNETAVKFKRPVENSNLPKPVAATKKKRKKQKTAEVKKASDAPEVNGKKSTIQKVSKLQNGRIEKRTKAKKQKENKVNLQKNINKEKLSLIKEQIAETIPAPTAATSLQEKLKQELLGGRFRFINEQLYTINSRKAEKLFQQDKEAFAAYHEGYRHQVQKWPMNPLDRIIKMIKRMPKSLEVGDFGCGDARLAKEVVHKVYSMDLVSNSPDVIACDMANCPLKSGSLDIAVYCLSLMGTNLKDYVLEANRVLKLHGLVYIAEIQSRFENTRDFVRLFEACGFEMIKKDVARNFFYFFQFKKMRNVGKVAIIENYSLKPCLYRKR